MSLVKRIFGHLESYWHTGAVSDRHTVKAGNQYGAAKFAPGVASGGGGGGHEFESHALDGPTACDACGRAAFGSRQVVTCRGCGSICHADCAVGGLGVACHRRTDVGVNGDGDASSIDPDFGEDAYVTAKDILLNIPTSPDRAYTLSSLDSRSIGRAGIHLLPAPAASQIFDAADSSGCFYAAWTPEKLNAHLFLAASQLPGQEFRQLGWPQPPLHLHHQQQHHHQPMQPPRFRGSLRVHVNLMRPVHSDKPAATFFLPRGHACLLHGLASDLGSDGVVWQLLAKLRIRDPAHKFGLYLHTVRGDSTVEVRRLAPHEKPLEILLSWTTMQFSEMEAAFKLRRFVLQESDSSTVDWDAFSIPELQNFLRILSLEEGQYERNIRLKFDSLRRGMAARLAALEGQMLMEESEA